jgi:amino acid adenylation domain-containing protein
MLTYENRSKHDILLAAESHEVERDYWMDTFKPGFIRGFIPYDCNCREEDGEMRSQPLMCRGQLLEGLTRLSNGSDVLLHLILLAAFVALLSRRTDGDDITIGVPIYRQDAGGHFINTALGLRCSVNEGATFKELLLEVRQQVLQATEHQNYPLEILCDKLGLNSSPCYFPLFDAALLLENIHTPQYLDHLPLNMVLTFRHAGGELTGELRYNGDLYEELTISAVVGQYLCLLNEAVKDVDCVLGEMSLLPPDARRRILEEFNDTEAWYPRDELVHRIFGRQVEAAPHRVAVIHDDSQVTYKWLAVMALGVASQLRRAGMAAGAIVGVLSGASPMAFAAFIGIMQTGGIYCPLDATAPPGRELSFLKDCAASFLLGQADLLGGFPEEDPPWRILSLEDCMVPEATGGVSGGEEIDAGDPAYVMFTSGSTGAAKGVLGTHRGILSLVKNTTCCDFSAGWRILQTGALSFDASTFEIWGSLLNGLTLCLTDKSDLLAPAALKRKIETYDIRCMWMTSPLFNQMVERDILLFRNLRVLIVGGDSLVSHQVNRVVERWPEICLFNGYGPTENATFSTIHRIEHPYQNRIPIGTPISNSTAYVVDARGRLVPPGVPGELWVGGDGVALGYLNDPELTADRFLSGVLQTDIYRTGDRARWLPNGTIDFLGRIDRQVKIRGFRVELGEIEAQLARHPLIREAVAVAAGDGDEKVLCAFLVPRGEVQVGALRLYLKDRLPDYMVPRRFVLLESIPLNTNGKVDYTVLGDPHLPEVGQASRPSGSLQKSLVDIWSNVLGIEADRIGIDDDFFSLGGHSLKATTLVAHIENQFGISIPLPELFSTPTVIGLAAYVQRVMCSSRVRPLPVEDRDGYQLCPAQERMYALWKWDPELLFYNIPFAGRLVGALDVPRMRGALKEIVRRHEALRTYYYESDGEVVQRVLPAEAIEFDIEDIDGGSIDCSGHGLKALYKQFLQPFDMETPPLFRVGLARIDKENHIFLVDVHHSVFDGTSLGIFLREFLALYSGEPLGPMNIQYRDYAYWLRDIQASGQLYTQKRFWLDRLDGCHAPVPLPVDFPEADTSKFRGGHLFFRLDRDVQQDVKVLLEEEGVTLYMFMLAVYNVMLSAVTGIEDILVGSPIAGRGDAAFQDGIGMYVNLLALRNFPSRKKNFRRFLAEVKENALAAYQNQNFHYVELVKALKERGLKGGKKFANVVMAMQNVDIPQWDLPGLQFQPLDFEYNISKYDLTFYLSEREDWIDVVVEYSTDSLKAETVERFFSDFKAVLLQTLANPDILLGDVETSFN